MRVSAATLTSISSSSRRRSSSWKRPLVPNPALLTTSSIGRRGSAMRSTTACCPSSPARSATSTSMPPWRPASASSRSARLATATVATPASASTPAITSPMPDEAPVTSAVENGKPAAMAAGQTLTPAARKRACDRPSALSASASCSCRSRSSARGLGGLRTVDVDVGTELGDVGEHRHLVVADLDEPAVDGDVEHGTVGEEETAVVLDQRRQERRMSGLEGDLAAAERARDDHRRLAREQHLLGRHDLDRHGRRHVIPPAGPWPWRAPARRRRR